MLWKGVKKYFQTRSFKGSVKYNERNTNLKVKILLTSKAMFLNKKVNSNFYLT